MIVLISIIIFIILSTIGLLLYVRKKGKEVNFFNKKGPLFLSGEETVDYLSSKVQLSSEEKIALAKLISLGGSNRLHDALINGPEVSQVWLVRVRRAIYNSLVLKAEEKENLEYQLYTILQKIALVRGALSSQPPFIKDISQGQSLEIKISDGTTFAGNFISGNKNTALIVLTQIQYGKLHEVVSASTTSVKILVSFWKEMDAGYAFQAVIQQLIEKKGSYQMSVKVISPLKRTKVRRYPRRAAEIPLRFQQGQISVDQESGAFSENYGRIFLGLLSDIGPTGGVILSHVPVPLDTQLKVEFPLFNDLVDTRAIVRGLQHFETVYSVNIEFIDISRTAVLEIYRFIYPDNS